MALGEKPAADFRTVSAAARALQNYPLNPNTNAIWDLGVVSYRRVGQRGPEAGVWLDRTRYPTQDIAVAAIEAAIGCKLQAYEGVAVHRDGAQPGAAPVKPSQPWSTPPPRSPGSGAAPTSVLLHGPPDD